VTINDLMRALVAELEEGDVPEPTYQEFPLALVWFDLCRLAGEEPPAAILAVVDDCSAQPVPPLVPTLRGSYADHARQFPEYAD
jgi:hypothetical protein